MHTFGGQECRHSRCQRARAARAELVDAAKALAAKVASGRMRVEDIDEQTFAGELSTAGQPENQPGASPGHTARSACVTAPFGP
jgi:hypothetical protein